MVPPVFGYCTRVLTMEDERTARDAYWRVVLKEHGGGMDEAEQRANLAVAIALNPFVAEPHILLAQLDYRRKSYAAVVSQCDSALTKLYAMATAWDKRMSFGAWVGYARLLRLRASRKLAGESTSLPTEAHMPPTQTPCPKQSPTQRRSEQSSPVCCASHSQPPGATRRSSSCSSSVASEGGTKPWSGSGSARAGGPRREGTPTVGTVPVTHLPWPEQLFRQAP